MVLGTGGCGLLCVSGSHNREFLTRFAREPPVGRPAHRRTHHVLICQFCTASINDRSSIRQKRLCLDSDITSLLRVSSSSSTVLLLHVEDYSF